MDAPRGLSLEPHFEGWRCVLENATLTCTVATLTVDEQTAPLGSISVFALSGRLVLRGGIETSIVMPPDHAEWLVDAIQRLQNARERSGQVPDALGAMRGER